MKILFPKWKHYLYDLSFRIRELKKYTYSGYYNPIIDVGDISTVVWGLAKYGKGGYIQRHLKVFWMWEFSKTILSRRWRNIATYKESEIATKIYHKLKTIKLEIIMSEIKLLKKYAEEVGISEKKIAKMDEDELIRAVVAAVDADKTYSKAFVAWYEDLPEEVFEEEVIEEEVEEPIKKKKAQKDEEEKVKVSAKKLERLLDTISEAEEMSELKEILEDNEDLFPKKVFKIKEFETLQEAMVEVLEEYEEKPIEKEEPKKKAKKEEPEEEEELVFDKVFTYKAKKEEPEEGVDNSKLIKKINKAEDVDDLKEIFKDNSNSFEGVSTRGIQKFENLKSKMLKCLSSEDEEVPVKEKPSTETNDLEEISKLPIPFLKKKAKEMGIKTLPGYSKEKIMGLIAEKMGVEIEEEVPVKVKINKKEVQKEEVEEVEVDQTFVNQLVRSKDIEALIDVAKELGVKVSILEKKSVKRLGAKLIEFLSEKEEVEEEAPKAKKEKGKSIYKEIEKAVLDGISFKKIVKAVTPLFEAKGEDDEEYIEKRVKQLVAIVKFDNDIED